MIPLKPDIFGAYCSAAIFFMALGILYFRNKRGLFLTAQTGMHLSFLFFFGLGSFFYAIIGITTDRIARNVVVDKIDTVFPYLVAGYALLFLYELYNRKNNSDFQRMVFRQIRERVNLNVFNLFILFLSFIGYIFSSSDVANSGAGTLFPVFSNLLLPVSILIVFNVKMRDGFSVGLFIALILLVGVQAFLSSWRSQLIMFFGCMLIGWSLRGTINYYVVSVLSLVFIIFIIPFQQLKKSNANNYDFNANAAFEQSLNFTLDQRLEMSGNFFAERINYTREMGYVQNAVDRKILPYRNGETYVEVVFQLIPRFLWEAKPVYNHFTGYEVPRKIGMLSTTDETSSWGVNSFAEFLYNFSYEYLPIFVIALYFLLGYLDKLACQIPLRPEYTWLLQINLFFLSLNLVSVIFSSTYFLWSFIVIIVLNALSGTGDEGLTVRRNTK